MGHLYLGSLETAEKLIRRVAEVFLILFSKTYTKLFEE